MSFSVEVPLPSRSESSKVELCGVQWIFERRADGLHAVAHDGRLLFEGMLGVPEGDAALVVEAIPPRHPVEFHLASDVVLAPGGAVRGWIALPLDLRLCFGQDELVHLEHEGLRLGWRERGGYHFVQESTLHKAPRLGTDARRLWLRVSFVNQDRNVVRPSRSRLDLSRSEVLGLRGFAVGPRVDWILGPVGGVHLRRLPRLGGSREGPEPVPFHESGEVV